MMWLLLFLSTLYAKPPDLESGDLLWGQGHYQKAMQAWKQTRKTSTPAFRSMAGFRMMLGASNILLPLYALQADQALMECDLRDPWCLIARVDREIMIQVLGFRPQKELCKELLKHSENALPQATASRRVALGLQPLHTLQSSSDGFGKTLLRHKGRWPRGPGGPRLGFGAFAGQRQGVGLSLNFVLPDVDRNNGILQTAIAVGTQRYGLFSSTYSSSGKYWLRLWGDIRRVTYFQRTGRTWNPQLISNASLSPAPGIRFNKISWWLGPLVRWDELEAPTRGHGLLSGFQWRFFKYFRFYQQVEASWIDYRHLHSRSSLYFVHKTGAAASFTADVAPNTEAPWWRWPTAGGGRYLRIPPAQWMRNRAIFAGTLEWRLWQKRLLGLSPFAEIGHAAPQTHIGAGLGLRLRLPPRPQNTIRLDIGYGTSGWGVLFGSNEFF